MKVKKINKVEKTKTYDLNIQDNHNYFVGKSEILVHNSGKDPSKVDRSAAYLCRYISKNIVKAGVAHECKVEIAYMIGVAKPVSINLEMYDKNKKEITISDAVKRGILKLFPLTPSQIIRKFDMKRPIYHDTAKNGHFGNEKNTWEQTDLAEAVKNIVG